MLSQCPDLDLPISTPALDFTPPHPRPQFHSPSLIDNIQHPLSQGSFLLNMGIGARVDVLQHAVVSSACADECGIVNVG